MANSDTDIANVTQDNLANHLRDIHLPEAVSFWPVAPGWWAIALLVLALGLFFIFSRSRKRNSNSGRLNRYLDQLYADFEFTGDVQQYCHQLTGLLREEVYGDVTDRQTGRESAAFLHGDNWVDWLEQSTDTQYSAAARRLLSDGCYRPSPNPPDRPLHNEIANSIIHFAMLNNRSSDTRITKATSNA